MALADAIDELAAGVDADGLVVRAVNVRPTSINGKHALDLVVSVDDGPERVLSATVYHGRPPHYQPWVELMDWTPELDTGDGTVPMAGSAIEVAVLDAFAGELGAGGRIFVEYEWDPASSRQLGSGVPPAVCRVGHLLWERGFTWFKDWYYPEGGQEGGLKLQGEKAISDERRRVHLDDVRGQLEPFVKDPPSPDEVPGVEACVERARGILKE